MRWFPFSYTSQLVRTEIPLVSKEAKEVANPLFENWYCRYGIPFEIQYDQGSEFTNDLIKRLQERVGVQIRHTTSYYHQANGQVERFNRTLKR